MLAVGLEVLVDAVTKLLKGDVQSPNMIAAAVVAVGALVMYVVYRYNSRLAAKTESHALKAVSVDNRSDALVSLGTIVGVDKHQVQQVFVHIEPH